MAKVLIRFYNQECRVIGEEQILTTGDNAYVFDDIANWVHKDGEFSQIPKGTKEIQIQIPCDM